MKWELSIANKETFIINLLLLILSVIIMISAIKSSSYLLGFLSILFSAIKVELKMRKYF